MNNALACHLQLGGLRAKAIKVLVFLLYLFYSLAEIGLLRRSAKFKLRRTYIKL